MGYQSKNMHYIYHVEYFEGLHLFGPKKPEEKQSGQKQLGQKTGNKGKQGSADSGENDKIWGVKEKNQAVCDFVFPSEHLFAELENMEQFCSFTLNTTYPGLLLGIGNPHQISEDGSFKLGFSFDYVTGLPYIPGSTLKGVLRSYFPEDGKKKKEEFQDLICTLLEQENGYEAEPLKQDIFEHGRDIFLGAYPVVEDQRGIMEREYITPHPSRFKNPNPISLLKVKPDVSFRFCFLLQDFVPDTGAVITAQDKLNLFRELLLLGGIGAKTNVGFGGLTAAK